MPVDIDVFKNTMSRYAAGVTVVTTLHGETPIGVTATAFNSVSATPPLVLICIAKGLFTHQAITESQLYAVNFLRQSQMQWGKLFAGMFPDVEDRFAGIETTTAETGAPILPDTVGYVDCRLHATHDAGDHSIFVGEVVAAGHAEGEPLLYYHRQWLGTIPLGE